jgi:hypothetical protein
MSPLSSPIWELPTRPPFYCATHPPVAAQARRTDAKNGGVVPQPLPITIAIDKTEKRFDEQKKEYTMFGLTVKTCCNIFVIYRRYVMY